MRAAIYARYSSDLQRDVSIQDQVRLCSARILAEGWTLADTYTDYEITGSIRLRPGYQKLLDGARDGAFDVVLAEGLDRLTRDMEDVSALYKHLTFHNVPLITIAEGLISELHVGLKGTMNALFLKDLGLKVRRGLEGRVRQGRAGGGLCYGYVVAVEYDSRGERVHGGRRINDVEAAVVLWIFEQFVSGRSPRAIAKQLNADGVKGPHGKAWGPSTIYGNWRRGTGILNNELYIGRLIWNRQRYVRDPTSRKRVARLNPPDAWVIQEVPELRIIDDALWAEAKRRQQAMRDVITAAEHGVRAERARRPTYLLSGLLRCGECGGGFSKVSEHHYGCSAARNRGTCTNLLTIRRDLLEASVLNGLKSELMKPERVKEFVADYHQELNRLNAGREQDHLGKRQELQRVERQMRAIIDAIKDGLRTAAMKDELVALEAKKSELVTELEHAPAAPAPRLDPKLADVYREQVARLEEELDRDDVRATSAQALRALIDTIRLVPEQGQLEIELDGDLAAILELASKHPRRGAAGVPVTLVAGT
ncbi:MAG TPA: recombinase family protein, partial [Solirubrobacteraceae bacterium]|nr:recombinase family protein [Solirubrobacteraceae bacterium]